MVTVDFFEESENIKLCPNDCGNFVTFNSSYKPSEVTCKCSSVFFTQYCCEANHKPATCAEVENWEVRKAAQFDSTEF